MTKRKRNRLLRTITFLLAIALGSLAVAGGIASAICYQTGMYGDLSKKQVLERVYNQLQEHYEMEIIDEIGNAKFDRLKGTNLTYDIYKYDDKEKEISNGHVYSVNDYLEYDTSDGIIWNLLYRNHLYPADDDYTNTCTYSIKDIVFNTADKIFYYRTDAECFPVQEISVATKYGELRESGMATNSSYLDYYYSSDKDAYICDNDNYQPLITNAYNQWTTAVIDGMELYTPCIVTKTLSDRYKLNKKNNYCFVPAYDEDALEDDSLLYIGDDTAFSSQNITTHDGLRTLVQVEPEISVEIEAAPAAKYVISSKVASPLDTSKSDLFVKCTRVIDALYPNHLLILYGTIITCGLFLALVITCCRCTLRMKPDDESREDKPELFARIPLFIYLLVMGSLLRLCLGSFPYIFSTWIEGTHNVINMNLTLLVEVVLIGLFIGMHILTNLCERIRTKTLRRYTVCYYLMKPFRRVSRALQAHAKQMQHFVIEHTSLFLRVGAVWIVLFLLQLFIIAVTGYDGIDAEIFLFMIYKLIEAAFIFIVIQQFSQLAKGGKELCEGGLSQKLDTSKLFGPFRRHAEHLNQINEGIQIAVQEQMKSEHFKTELITNVTHDIKTPLTSIINYVDLLNKDGITAEETNEYLEVLDRQSARLKKLIEDLIEASKASTGNTSVIFEPCDLEILLTQTLGEFEEKLLANHLELIIRNTAQRSVTNGKNTGETGREAIIICADNRHLWRIFDNLMNNICKYAQPHTRVYIDLEAEQGLAKIVFRNTSRYPLEIDGDALLERFVRGDTSRNTEGNGLGLSIAKNLAELMGGTLKLYVDGDLFKVIITFPIRQDANEE